MIILFLMKLFGKGKKNNYSKKLHFPIDHHYKCGICSLIELHLLKLS